MLIYCTFADDCSVNIWVPPASPCLSPAIVLGKTPYSASSRGFSATTFRRLQTGCIFLTTLADRNSSIRRRQRATPNRCGDSFAPGRESAERLWMREIIDSHEDDPGKRAGFKCKNSSDLPEFPNRKRPGDSQSRHAANVPVGRVVNARTDGVSMIWPRIFRIG